MHKSASLSVCASAQLNLKLNSVALRTCLNVAIRRHVWSGTVRIGNRTFGTLWGLKVVTYESNFSGVCLSSAKKTHWQICPKTFLLRKHTYLVLNIYTLGGRHHYSAIPYDRCFRSPSGGIKWLVTSWILSTNDMLKCVLE